MDCTQTACFVMDVINVCLTALMIFVTLKVIFSGLQEGEENGDD